MTRASKVTELLCLAAWASAQASKPGAVNDPLLPPAAARQFARNCRERARLVEIGEVA
jgi:hypothetical protein